MVLQQKTPSGKDRLGEKRQREETQNESRQQELQRLMRTAIQLLLKHEDQLQGLSKQDSFIWRSRNSTGTDEHHGQMDRDDAEPPPRRSP